MQCTIGRHVSVQRPQRVMAIAVVVKRIQRAGTRHVGSVKSTGRFLGRGMRNLVQSQI